MADNSFFNEQKEQSKIKTCIVTKYFLAWSQVIINTQKKAPHRNQKIAYIDLFAGPGRYDDGTVSTPLLILQKAIENDDLKDRLVTLFNDKDIDNFNKLKQEIFSIHKIDTLKYPPNIMSNEVGEEIVKLFESFELIPTFFFVDPWGYKGLSLKLVNSVIKNWGCDAIFFFNYNRIKMGIWNPAVQHHVKSLFGESGFKNLTINLNGKEPHQKENIIIEELSQSLKFYGAKYVLPFTFKNEANEKTSHHLIFVSKSFRGYDIMKEIMAKESTSHEEGVPSFTYNPCDSLPQSALLFKLNKPIEDLKTDLLQTFKNRTLTMKEIYESDSVDKPYIRKNYRQALTELLSEKKISCPQKQPRKGTFAPEIMVSFPS